MTELISLSLSRQWVLFGHPCILNLPSSGSVDKYYQLASSLLPTQCHQYPWSLALTDGKVSMVNLIVIINVMWL